MLLSIYGFTGALRDPARLQPRGKWHRFPGAGTILRRLKHKEFTAAASSGRRRYYLGSFRFYLSTVIATVAVPLSQQAEQYLIPHEERSLRLHTPTSGQVAAIATHLVKTVNIRSMKLDTADDGECYVEMRVETPYSFRMERH